LDDRRRYIETLLANLSTAVISLDPDGSVTTANPAAATILGIKLLPGDDARAALDRHGLAPLAELLDREMRAGAGQPHDLALQQRGGLHIAVQVSPLRSGAGDRVGTLVMVEDLTDLIRAQRAEAWREVAQRIAHEIKNPLTPIQLAAQRLRKKFNVGSDDLERVVSESTSSIEREVGALKQMIDEFSKFARMPEIATQMVSFPELVESVLALYEGVTQIEWQVEIEPSIGDVLLDPQQIRRVLINLIDNAVAALGDSGGTVRVHATQVGAEGLRIEVADTGPGIPSTDRDRMFVPYFSTKRQGSGLGLAIVHKVVTDHRGTIRVEDNTPHGARFVIDIPA
jgi:two-component system nitrogen regulation sensor histidine kinase NtrY